MMRPRSILASVLAGLGVLAATPAVAATPQLVVSKPDNTFSNASQTIALGETVNFSNAPDVGGGGEHNVEWDDNGVKPTPPDAVDTPWTAKRTFTRPGLYRYFCEEHGSRNGVGMAGKVVVRNADGSLPDITSPRLGRVTTATSRRTFEVKFSSGESGKATGKLTRKSGARFRSVGTVSFPVRKGKNRVRIRKAGRSQLRTGRYRLTFVVKDAAGNASATKTVAVTLAD